MIYYIYWFLILKKTDILKKNSYDFREFFCNLLKIRLEVHLPDNKFLTTYIWFIHNVFIFGQMEILCLSKKYYPIMSLWFISAFRLRQLVTAYQRETVVYH